MRPMRRSGVGRRGEVKTMKRTKTAKTKRPSKRLVATAHHEAAHAVVAIALGSRVTKVSIVPGEDYLGIMRQPRIRKDTAEDVEYCYSDRALRWIEREVVIYQAGRFGDKLVTRKNNWVGASSDNAKSFDLLYRACGSEREVKAHWRLLSIRAESMVNGPVWRPAIKRVAKRLLEVKTLTGREVKAIMFQPIIRDQPPPPQTG